MTASADGDPAGEARPARIPDFFIVGQPKSGTTALYEALRMHPQLFMPELKEPVFLASDLIAGLRRPTVRARPQTLIVVDIIFNFVKLARSAVSKSAHKQRITSAFGREVLQGLPELIGLGL